MRKYFYTLFFFVFIVYLFSCNDGDEIKHRYLVTYFNGDIDTFFITHDDFNTMYVESGDLKQVGVCCAYASGVRSLKIIN